MLPQVHPFIAAPGWFSIEQVFARAAAVAAGAGSSAALQPTPSERETAGEFAAALDALKARHPPDFELRELDVLRTIGQDETLKVLRRRGRLHR